MRTECDEISRRLRLAAEAKTDYQTAKLDRTVKAAVVQLRRDQMELAMLNLLTYMEDHWAEVRKRVPGAFGV